jgi:hypothetical protein
MGSAMSKTSGEPELQSIEGGGDQVILETQIKFLATSPCLFIFAISNFQSLM